MDLQVVGGCLKTSGKYRWQVGDPINCTASIKCNTKQWVKIQVFGDVKPSRLVSNYLRFERLFYVLHSGLSIPGLLCLFNSANRNTTIL